MTIFLSGGAKNGKSTLAQELAVKLSGAGKRYYVATMIPTDEEDLARIRRHVADERQAQRVAVAVAGANIDAPLSREIAHAGLLLI